jgi:signal transduction histidine kinase
MENALRYGRQGGHLNIGIRRDAEVFSITFADDGPGVDPDFLPIIFERFTRADASRARHSGGSGLGLSIARAICLAGILPRLYLKGRSVDRNNAAV